MKILLIEDEPSIAAVVQSGLEKAGYAVEAISDGQAGLARAEQGTFALLILDLMLPGRDGWSICETLREAGNRTPILMLTARDSVRDRVRGLELGADDYLPKPFDFTELRARVNALIRRDRVHKTRVIRVGDLEIDTSTRRVRRAGQEISLTPREYSLLEALAAHEGQTLTREAILERVWADDESLSNTVEVFIRSLRRKVDAGFPAKLIHTLYGIGYTLRRPEGAA